MTLRIPQGMEGGADDRTMNTEVAIAPGSQDLRDPGQLTRRNDMTMPTSEQVEAIKEIDARAKRLIQEEMVVAIETLEKAEKNIRQFFTAAEVRDIKAALKLVIPIESRLYHELKYGKEEE